jgi:molecular chaperone DnaK
MKIVRGCIELVSYGLGVDLGTSFTTAAVSDDGQPHTVTLGDHAVANGAKQHLGDSTSLTFAGGPQSAVSLLTATLNSTVDIVTELKGAPPDRVVLTHPAVWGQHRREQFHEVRRQTGLDAVNILTEPAAAATHYANRRRLPIGSTIAVYDLGGGTFDTTVTRLTEAGTEVVGVPQGLEWVGGNAFDEAVLDHVDQSVGGAVSDLDPTDPKAATTRHQLRLACRMAKETLSQEESATISVALPGRRTDVRLSRLVFERMIHASLRDTVAALLRALDSAEQTVDDLAGVLVIGGSAQIPMVTRLLSEALGRPIVVDPQAQQCVALGSAALSRPQPLSARAFAAARPPTPTQAPTPTPPVGVWPIPAQSGRIPAYTPAGPAVATSEAITTLLPTIVPEKDEPLTDTGSLGLGRSLPAPVDLSEPDSFPNPTPTGRDRDRRRIWMIGAGVGVALLFGAGLFAINSGSDNSSTGFSFGDTGPGQTDAGAQANQANQDADSTSAAARPGKSPTTSPTASKSPTPTPSTSTTVSSTTSAPATSKSQNAPPVTGNNPTSTTSAPATTTSAVVVPNNPETTSLGFCNNVSGTRMTVTANGSTSAPRASGGCARTQVPEGASFQVTLTRTSDGATRSSQTFTQKTLNGTVYANGSFASASFSYPVGL